MKWIGMISLQAMAIVLALLTYLSEQYYNLLKLLLGLVILLAGSRLMISPRPYARKSNRTSLSP